MKSLKHLALSLGPTVISFTISASSVLALDGLGTVEKQAGYVSNIGQLITGILNVVMLVAAILVFLYLILGGIEWITSGGDKGKTESARNKITAAIVGLIILAASYALLQLSLQLLGFDQGIQSVFEKINPITGAKGEK